MRPLRGELKCKDFDLYRATYCGLCRTLRRRCGVVAPMILNYDFTFLAVLLAPAAGETVTCKHRCHVVPTRRCMCEQSPALEQAADASVILAYWQTMDKIRDEKGLARLGAGCVRVLLGGAYSRAVSRLPEFADTVRMQLDTLHRLEQERCPSLDRPADAFATLLVAAASVRENAGEQRAMEQLLYHLGRWIYLIDARDDLEEDRRSGNYNPIALRWGDTPTDAELEATLNRSAALMRSAAALLDFGRQTELVENVLNYGLPAVQKAVLSGQWKQMKKQKIWSNKV